MPLLHEGQGQVPVRQVRLILLPQPQEGRLQQLRLHRGESSGHGGSGSPRPGSRRGHGGRRTAERAEDGQGQRAAPRSAELPAGPGPPLAPLAPRAPRSLRREPRPAHGCSALPHAPASRERISERRDRSERREAEDRSDPRRRQRDSSQQRGQEAAIFPGPQCTALRSAAWDKQRRAGPTTVAMVTAEAPLPPAVGPSPTLKAVRRCSKAVNSVLRYRSKKTRIT